MSAKEPFYVTLENTLAQFYDTPNEFLEIIGVMIAGSALAKRVYWMSPDEVYTNSYIIMCAPPGWYHKSSPLRKGIEILRMVLPSQQIMPNMSSDEALFRLSSNADHGIMYYDEFSSFMKHVGKEYASGTLNLIMEKLEKGQPIEMARVKGKDEVTVKQIPADFVMSFIASTTTTWLFGSLRKEQVDSGFLSRFLIVESATKTRTYYLQRKMDQSVKDRLAKDLDKLLNYYRSPTEFILDPKAADLYRDLYFAIEKDVRNPMHPALPSATSRLPTYIKKLALISAACRMPKLNLIMYEDVEWAGNLVLNSMKSLKKLLKEGAFEDRFQRYLYRAETILQKKQKMSKRELYRSLHAKPEMVESVVMHLESQGKIEMNGDGKNFEWKG